MAAASSLLPLEASVLAEIDRSRLVELAGELIAAGGENPGGTEAATVAILHRVLTGLGATVHLNEVAPGRANLIAHLGGDQTGGGLLFLGHSDVVPAGQGWDSDAFTPREDQGRLIGRGATDMKGGLAAVLVAMASVHARQPRLPLTLVCTVDEEADAIGIAHYVATEPAGSYTGCVVAEPTDLVAIVACRGAANFVLRITGASAHAGRPTDGASAIQAAAEIIAEIGQDTKRLAAAKHPVLGAATWNIGTIAGGHGTSIVPDTCELSLDRRLLPNENARLILEHLLVRIRGRLQTASFPGREKITVHGELQMQMPGFLTEEDSDFVTGVRQAVRDVTGTGDVGIWTASCEGGYMAEHHRIPTLVLGPGEINTQAHQPNESVEVDDLLTAARAYALFALRHASNNAQTPSTS
ncbi:M20 family metallopeptidase [Paeniglutamicibacter sp.]|uniref:M20 family metallopeptidase n=1 Tax=Paeniglutamicibacter sp. TaxID=1934391 RepID=UPI00398A412E